MIWAAYWNLRTLKVYFDGSERRCMKGRGPCRTWGGGGKALKQLYFSKEEIRRVTDIEVARQRA
jgi:hypothetical protein